MKFDYTLSPLLHLFNEHNGQESEMRHQPTIFFELVGLLNMLIFFSFKPVLDPPHAVIPRFDDPVYLMEV